MGHAFHFSKTHWMKHLTTKPTRPKTRPTKITKVPRLPSLRRLCQLADDEQHVKHESPRDERQAKGDYRHVQTTVPPVPSVRAVAWGLASTKSRQAYQLAWPGKGSTADPRLHDRSRLARQNQLVAAPFPAIGQ